MLELGDRFELVYTRKEYFEYPVGSVFTVIGPHPMGMLCSTEGEDAPLLFAGFTGSMGVCVYRTHDGWQYVHPGDVQVLAYFRVLDREWANTPA